MKHHNLYRLALLGYWIGGALLLATFVMIFLAVTTNDPTATTLWDGKEYTMDDPVSKNPYEGLAWLCGISGALLLGMGFGAHLYAIDQHEELKPLPKDVRRKIELEARTRRADLELERTIEDAEERTRIIQGKAIEKKRDEDWYH